MAIDVAPLNRALLRRHFFGVQLPNENTLLRSAADQNALNLAKSLVRGGTDIDHPDSVEITPLANAAQRGISLMGRFWLENKARVDVYDDDGDTALHKACNPPSHILNVQGKPLDEENRRRVAASSSESGIDINATNDRERSALYYAIRNDCTEPASNLLEAGEFVEVRSDQEKEESRIAATNFKREPTLPLQTVPGVSMRDQIVENSILHLAVENGQRAVVCKLIDRGIDINTIDYPHWTALEHAQEMDDEEMV